MDILNTELFRGITVLHAGLAIIGLVLIRNALMHLGRPSADSGPMVSKRCKKCEWSGRIGQYVKKCPKCGLAL